MPVSAQIHDQTNLLPRAKLLIVLAALASTLCITYMDQSAMGILLPTIGKELDCASTIIWAGTSAMISNAAFQVLYGRLSDIFGRKVIMLVSLGLLALGDLLCGFAKTGTQLYVFRAISGLANGGIMAICMMIVSDIVTLEERGKYQGIQGSSVGLGNLLGPFIAAGFTERTSWRDLFYLITGLACLAGLVIILILPPSNMPNEDLKTKLRKIDYIGILTSSAAIILLLVPISGIGSYFSVKSAMVIAMLALGSVFTILFVLTEWRIAKLPMIPLRLFAAPALTAMLVQQILIGITFYGILYYMPVYYQTVRGWSQIVSASLIVPLTASQAVASSVSGYYISRKQRYGEVMWCGYGLWAIAAGVQCKFGRTTPAWGIALTLVVEGVGVGCVFQPTLVAAQAHSRKEDRAVVISARNFLRAAGGAAGLALSNTIFSNTLKNQMPTTLPPSTVAEIESSIFGLHDLTGLSQENRDGLLDAYVTAARAIFILWAVAIALCLMLMVLVKDKGLTRRVETEGEVQMTHPGVVHKDPVASEKGNTVPVDSQSGEEIMMESRFSR